MSSTTMCPITGLRTKLLALAVWGFIAALPVRTTNEVTLVATPTQVYDGVPAPLTLNCSHHFSQSQGQTLLSMMLLKATGSGNFTEVCSISSFARGVVAASNSSIQGSGTGYLAALTDSFLTWNFPTSTSVSGTYRCQTFGMDTTGHPSTSTADTHVVGKSLDLAGAMARIQELNSQQVGCDQLKAYHTAILDAHKQELETLIANHSRQSAILDSFRQDTFLAVSGNHQGHMYYLSHRHNAKMSVLAAQSECSRWGGYLAEISDQAELDFVVNFLNSSSLLNGRGHGHHFLLLGATDEGHDGTWRFLTSGDPVLFLKFYVQSHSSTRQNCLYLRPSPQVMTDGACDQVTEFLCELRI